MWRQVYNWAQVTCDGCATDLTTRTNSVDYRLVLESESKPGYGAGCYTDMMIYPPIDRTHHFCGLCCLDLWRDRQRHMDKLHKAALATWTAEHGTRSAFGYLSYPAPPPELIEAQRAEFLADALMAFPIARPRK